MSHEEGEDVMVPTEVIDLALQAVEADQDRDYETAVRLYTQAADELDKLNDKRLSQKSSQYRSRAKFLAPKVQQEKTKSMAAAANLASKGTKAIGDGHKAVERAGGASVVAGAAVVGAGVGFLTLGSTAAVLGAGAAAYAATRKDQVGDTARQVGNVANTFASRVYEFNQQHRITERARDAAVATYHKAKDLNKKYQITDQASEMASKSYQKAKEYNEKHQITTKIGSAVSSGLESVTKAMSSNSQGPSQASMTLPSAPPPYD